MRGSILTESSQMPEKKPDYLSQAGASLLARRIEKYWRDQGNSKITVAVIPITHPTDMKECALWGVRSNVGLSGPPN